MNVFKMHKEQNSRIIGMMKTLEIRGGASPPSWGAKLKENFFEGLKLKKKK
jgi:hypothetical protein